MIEVFVHSYSPYIDVETAREMSLHTFCAPNCATDIVSKFKGCTLSQEDLAVLEQVSQVADETSKFAVHDVSSLKGKVIAMRRGIRRTPAVIINGEKFEGKEKALQAISSSIIGRR